MLSIAQRLLRSALIIALCLVSYGCHQVESDKDLDGIPDEKDNCVYVANADQKDMDSDGYGDACDNCPTLTFLRFSDQQDSDGDGIGDLCDNCINTQNADQADQDRDGIGDVCSQEADVHHYETISRAAPDECFFDIGSRRNNYDPEGFDLGQCTEAGGRPKMNEGYIWGMTKADSKLYFGTFANAICNNTENAHVLDSNEMWVCERKRERNANRVVDNDRRPPGLYSYDTETGIQKRLTIRSEDISTLNDTYGLRSAANHNGVVFIGGPNKGRNEISLFAFNAQTGAPLGAEVLPYRDIRRWIIVNDRLYCGVSSQRIGGAVLKWVGDLSNPFAFEVVGKGISFEAAYLTYHEGRLYATTWPASGTSDLIDNVLFPDIIERGADDDTSLWMSPPIDGELNAGHADQWQKVWSIYDYEPDDVCAYLSGGGPVLSYNGWIYWSTMHIKNQATAYRAVRGLGMNSEQKAYAEKGAYRATSIFRGRNLDNPSAKTIELLYGEEMMDVYTTKDGWQKVPNMMDPANRKPKYGHSGFGNLANNYMWSAIVHKGKLYFATMDDLGADLYCFPDENSEAKPVDIHGFGNMANFGIRNIVSDGDHMYLGTANHFNISTYTAGEMLSINPGVARYINAEYLDDDLNAAGGWELIRLDSE